MAITLNNGTDYINSDDYKKLSNRLEELKEILEDNSLKSFASRNLRYAEVDIEVEREAGRIQPDELYIPDHTIDKNIRREQASYVQFVSQSPRAVIVSNKDDPSIDMTLLEKDLTDRLRFDGWQLACYANIDGFQANGYGIVETVYEDEKPGDIGREYVQFGDFAFVSDTRDIKDVEMLARTYHYTKTRLLALCSEATAEQDRWDEVQVNKVIGRDQETTAIDQGDVVDSRDKSLYNIQKVMYKVNGIVHCGWACIGVADDWLRAPRPLYLGRRELIPQNPLMGAVRQMANMPPPSQAQFETEYPYFLYPYLISENDTINQLKGRVFLDQDIQEAVASLTSSTVTQARRAAGLYGSKDVSDPNDDLMMQKNVFLKSGCVMNSKITFTQLAAPDPGIFSAINMLRSANQDETSQVSFAVSNRQDSRKTAEELKLAQSQQQNLSTVQVVLYSNALRNQYQYEVGLIVSRVLAGIIKPNPKVLPMYSMNFTVKPSGDTDVIERAQMVQSMQQAWGVIQNTGAAIPFLVDMLEKMFPDNASKYVAAMQQQMAQQNSAQAQQQQQLMGFVKQLADGIVYLSKQSEMFSETGKIHALPTLKMAAEQIKQIEEQTKGNK